LIDRQRIDKWLWHSRIVRTRTAAAELAQCGHVRVNGVRVNASSRMVRVGDVLTISLYGGVRVLKVAGFASQRGSGTAGRLLYEDLGGEAASRPSTRPRPLRGNRPWVSTHGA
jgi:ribosome-associated heat shock protein Hsp15